MEVIRNEPSCSSASCHKHPASQSVLGVVDITYSLGEINQMMKAHVVNMVAVSIGFILLISLSAGWLLHRMIYVRSQTWKRAPSGFPPATSTSRSRCAARTNSAAWRARRTR